MGSPIYFKEGDAGLPTNQTSLMQQETGHMQQIETYIAKTNVDICKDALMSENRYKLYEKNVL
ncbi:MAG: hypothetical protein HFH68_16380 [Lachnospiraceae bacterium]|nr:hypothetical protein [Lachnospiraceae bacterium]